MSDLARVPKLVTVQSAPAHSTAFRPFSRFISSQTTFALHYGA